MNMFGQAEPTFDVSGVEAQKAFEPIPAGTYMIKTTSVELKDSKSGGQYIKVELQIVDGEHKGRKLWTNFNIRNNNAQAVTIGLGQLKGFSLAAGNTNPAVTLDAIRAYSCYAVVKVRKDEGYGDQNEVTSFKDKP